MNEELLLIIVTLLLEIVVIFAAYKMAKIPGDLTIKTLAICVIVIGFKIFILAALAQFYLIFKLYFMYKKDKEITIKY